MKDTLIEWTDRTWNPVSGCTKVSAGCKNCYAETIANRFGAPAYPNGFDITLRPHRLEDPKRWQKPARVFVNSTPFSAWTRTPSTRGWRPAGRPSQPGTRG